MASVFQALPQLRTAAPRLSRRLFSCRQCLNSPIRSAVPASTRSTRPSVLQSVRWKSTQPLRSSATIQSSNPSTASLAEAAAAAEGKSSSFPKTTSKSVAYWLLGSAASVFGIVVFGGLTRLTESGLSITEWRPFALLNSSMDLADFKQIYFMEWAHRLWGRVIGVTMVLPTAYFIARRRVTPSMAWKLVGICGMIGFQGAIGWWMVKSGLKDDLFEPGSHPRVSQYRLTAHLGTAFAVYCSMILTGLSILKEHRMLADPAKAAETIKALNTRLSKELFDPFYSHVPDHSDLWWRNMLENPSLVQLDHRILATTPLLRTLPKEAHKGVQGLVHLVSLQVTLGISTLTIWYPPGAVVLFSRISMPRRAVLGQIMKPQVPRTTATPHIASRLEAAKVADKSL
ncbi:cytochrome oxidase assembly protein-domain-containing protein [Bipolaris maydis]|nr:cytochrome oxidase assembly protein-domain-containing protein [Bipolaris maydis]